MCTCIYDQNLEVVGHQYKMHWVRHTEDVLEEPMANKVDKIQAVEMTVKLGLLASVSVSACTSV